MSRLLFLLPVLFIACGTQPKTVNGALQAEDGAPEKEELAEEKPAEPTEVRQAEDKPTQVEDKPTVERVVLVIKADTQNSGGLENESYEEVFSEVKAFIENLNKVIQNKNYSKWIEALSDDRLKEISSREFLASVSNSDFMRRRRIEVKTVNDYFIYVVVPSRANSQVDKIEILDNNRVKAFYENTRKETTELVYELIKNGNTWKILR
jgi:hypothetical protein